MKNLIYILIMSFGLSTQAQNIKVKLVDTIEKNIVNIDRLEETEDCTVRAIAEGFDLEYLEALQITLKMGRKRRRGMNLRQYVRGLQTFFHSQIITSDGIDPMIAKDFVNTIAEDGFTYIVISAAHTFVIEQGYKGRWKVKGNYDDLKTEIIMYAKIENQYGK